MKKERKEHESYGMIDISRFSSNRSEFFGSDLIHSGGISITISTAEKERTHNSDWYHAGESLIRVELSHSQFAEAITSGMNTSGVPCTLKRYGGESIPQIEHGTDKKDLFSNNMKDTQDEYKKRIDRILGMLDGNIGKRKAAEIQHELKILKNHVKSNTEFVMQCFDEAMEKSVVEAKHTVSNYIDHKLQKLGIEKIKEELTKSLEPGTVRRVRSIKSK